MINKSQDEQKTTGKKVIIACSVMKPELEAIIEGDSSFELRYLDSTLHDTPKKMPELLQQEIDAVESYATQIVLGYGFCSNGIAGVKAPRQGIIVPRVHDCIALFIGSIKAYDSQFKAHPGTYYLTPGWLEEDRDPLGYMEKDYVPKMGREKAEMGTKLTFAQYSHITLIDTGVKDLAPMREIGQKNAKFLDLEYNEIDGTHEYFIKILYGPHDEKNFIHFKENEIITIDF
ncbi:MAG: DUF1638 domain-containing protein [Deltaproteobacteria bacterium]|nr:DUF1638 domain-containing protein [Deltaproteobacteria bacterium]